MIIILRLLLNFWVVYAVFLLIIALLLLFIIVIIVFIIKQLVMVSKNFCDGGVMKGQLLFEFQSDL